MKSLEFDPNFVIRGLFYDPKRSLMMKLDSYSVIDDKAVFRGLERVSKEELDEIYSTRRMGVHRTDQKFSRHGHSFYQVLRHFVHFEKFLMKQFRFWMNFRFLRRIYSRLSVNFLPTRIGFLILF